MKVSLVAERDCGLLMRGIRCQVLAHPQFQADPIAAVASHLAATLPPAPPPPKPAADPARRRQQKQLQKQRRKERRMAEG